MTFRVKPRASRPGVGAVREGAIEVRVSAPPVEGAANEELLALVSRTLDLPRRAVAVVSGERGRLKRVRVEGVTAHEARTRLGIP